MRLLNKADVTPEIAQKLAEAASEIRYLRMRNTELERAADAATLSGLPAPRPMPESEAITALRREVEQHRRNAAALADQLAVAEGRDKRVRMGGWAR